MAILSRDFDAYKVFYYSNQPYAATIYCYQGGALVGRMVFVKDGAAVARNSTFGGGPSLCYSIDEFDNIMEVLLHEKPLYLFLNLDNLTGYLATAQVEPVGEEE